MHPELDQALLLGAPDVERLRPLERWCLVVLELIRGRIAEIERGDRGAEAARNGPIVAPLTE
ncbi:hypothetical protein [Streptomyces sp. NPDC057695]|uniref:hypothetical protein n=1 Tax=Streptomyces sp. NPDC057695 TaxID=3346217 RepID=UPI0036A14591